MYKFVLKINVVIEIYEIFQIFMLKIKSRTYLLTMYLDVYDPFSFIQNRQRGVPYWNQTISFCKHSILKQL